MAVFTFSVYLPSIWNSFVQHWDDYQYIYQNALIRSFDLHLFKTAFISRIFANWQPLVIISYAVDYRLWGLNPLGYHLENVILHSINTLLVAVLASRLYAVADGADDYNAVFAGVAAALLFGLHPLHVESVSWVSERKDVLSGFFFISCIIVYINYARCEGASRGSAAFYYLLSFFLFILALMSKPMAITMPAVLLLLDFYPLGRLKRLKMAIIEKTPFFIMSVLSALLTIWAQKQALSINQKYPPVLRLGNAVHSYMFYLYKTALPLHLAPFYQLPLDPFGLAFFASLALFLIISTLCALTISKKKIFTAVWLYYIITLAPVIGIIQAGSQAAADRYTYIPHIGIFVAMGGGLGYFIGRIKNKTFTTVMVTAGALAIISALSMLTIIQERIWRNPITLWTREVQEFKDAAIGYNNRGDGYLAIGDYAHAMEDFTSSIRLYAFDAGVYNERGLVYLRLKQWDRAIEDFNKAVALKPAAPVPRSNRGICLLMLGRPEEAIEDFKTSIILDPLLGTNYYYIGLAYSKMGNSKDAAVYLQKAKEMGVKAIPQ